MARSSAAAYYGRMSTRRVAGTLFAIVMAIGWLGAGYLYYLRKLDPIMGVADAICGIVFPGAVLFVAWRTNARETLPQRLVIVGYGLAAILAGLGLWETFTPGDFALGMSLVPVGGVVAMMVRWSGKPNAKGS